MCGRVRLSSDYSEIKIRLKFAPDSVPPNFEASWNKPPTEPMLVAIRSKDGKRIPKMMRWGLLALLKPCRDEALKIWPVDKMVGNVRNNGPQLILPVFDKEKVRA
jgi:putative SOS response-associated peptidase YedK